MLGEALGAHNPQSPKVICLLVVKIYLLFCHKTRNLSLSSSLATPFLTIAHLPLKCSLSAGAECAAQVQTVFCHCAAPEFQ